ncbi:MAG TPA: beta-ketoacyl synthase N-terminal-like domain-containing protein, partial [Thermoanaerobaculia bacterium]|nr:beta-ketoacyl synthase N-terminal-like domain-containing protein [Thermoanaerobaculia bacterium]
MLELLNRFGHGVAVIPTIAACCDGGLFDRLAEEGPLDAATLAARIGANEGHLRVALRLLEGLGWVERDGDRYALTNAAEARHRVPASAMEWLSFDFRGWLRGATSAPEFPEWRTGDSDIDDYLDGLIATPLLIALQREKLVDPDSQTPFAVIRADARDVVARFFMTRGWAVEGEGLTEAGKYLLSRIWNAATVLSYAPMFLRLRELLFGAPAAVFARAADGAETHVDRALNVEACGHQHEKYFAAADETILAIFDAQPIAQQPRYVVDTGCGDGSFLQRIYEVVRDRSARGKVLDRFPLTMIGADYAPEALAATTRRLREARVPHLTVRADIGDPARLLSDLRTLGVESADDVLHVRSFLDHDRPFLVPEGACEDDVDGVFVDDDGRSIDARRMQRSLVEHLGRWANVAGRHGIVLLEVHSLAPSWVRRFRDRSESLHFDAYHGYSNQYLVAADAFLLAAAEARLFARNESFRRFPRTLPFTRITLGQFEQRDYAIRRMRIADLDAVARLEGDEFRQPLDVLQRRVERGGSYVIEYGGRVAGVVHTQRIANVELLRTTNQAVADALHDPAGAFVHLLGLSVDRDARSIGLGDHLLKFVLQMASVQPSVEGVAGVTRCRDYRADRDGSLIDYVARREDANLRFHHGHGATIGELIAGYRPDDVENGGFGVLVQYDLRSTQSARVQSTTAPSSPEIELASAIRRVLDKPADWIVPPSEPLMQLGLDSVGLMELRALIEERFSLALGDTFFFKHPTLAAAAASLAERSAAQVASASPAIEELDDPRSVAIVGMAYRFPGAERNDLWSLLRDGRCAITDPPRDRWKGDDGRVRGGYLSDVAAFDAAFFRIPPSKAELMDPQQRMMLELSWELFERAGYRAGALAQRAVGVFVGACHFEYREAVAAALPEGDGHLATGTFASMLSNRVSFFFDLRGPSVTIDTACSSSLVAVHEAVKALREGECELAIAGGVNLICGPTNTMSFRKAGMLSPDALCRTFDADANGYVRGEGGALLLLAPLARARQNGDTILGIIRGTAVNHGGAANSLTSPNPNAQRELVVRAMRDARVAPSSVTYIEAHGTATPLGDPIEVEALQDAFRELDADATSAPWCALGSIKSNIGHLEGAAGVAGMIKVLLAMRERTIPPTLHFTRLNPRIRLEGSPFTIARLAQPWMPAGRRRAGVSSFGFGGANAHVILEEAPEMSVVPRRSSGRALIAVSAFDEAALARGVDQLADFLSTHPEVDLHDVAYTLHQRERLPHRLAFYADDVASAIRKLRARAAEGVADEVPRGRLIELPTYPFARTRFWIPGAPQSLRIAGDEPWFVDHVAGGRAIVPGMFFVHAAGAAALEDVAFTAPLASAGELSLAIDGDKFEIRSSNAVHARGRISVVPARPAPLSFDASSPRVNNIYAHFARLGCEYGPSLRVISELHRDGDTVTATIHSHDVIALLDGALQTALALIDDATSIAVAAIQRIVFFEPPRDGCRVHTRRRGSLFDIDLFDERGQVLVRIEGVALAIHREPLATYRPVSIPDEQQADDVFIACGAADAASERQRAWDLVCKIRSMDRGSLRVITNGIIGASLTGIVR